MNLEHEVLDASRRRLMALSECVLPFPKDRTRRAFSRPATAEVVALPAPAKPKRTRRPRQKSFYEIYRMPFFNQKAGLAWDVPTTGDYAKDCVLGGRFGREFLDSCDGSHGWSSLLGKIVLDMHENGTAPGLIVGFMGAVSDGLCSALSGEVRA